MTEETVLLNRESKTSKTNLGIVPNTLIGFGADVITYLLSFLVSIVVARALGPTDRGSFAIITLFNLYLLYFFTLGISATSAIQVAKKEYPLSTVHTFVILFSVAVGLVCLFLYFVLKQWLLQTVLRQVDAKFGLVAVLLAPFVIYSNAVNDMMIGMGEVPKLNFIKLVKSMIDVVGPVLLLLVIPLGLNGAVVAWVISVILIVFIQGWWLLKLSGWRLSFSWSVVRSSFGFGWKLYLAFLPWVAIMQMDSFVLNHFHGLKEVGFYTVAYAFMFKIVLLFGALINAAKSRIIGDSEHLSEQLVRRLIRHSVFIGCGLVFILGFIGRSIICWFYGEVYAPAVGAMMILSIGMIAIIVTNFLDIYVVGQLKKPGACALINWGVFFVGLSLYFLMVPKYGLLGTAAASSLIAVVRAVAYLSLLRWLSASTVRDTFVLRKDDLIFLRQRFNLFYESLATRFATERK